MPRKKEPARTARPKMRKAGIAYGIFVSLLGCLWLSAELGWIQTGVPIGPISIILIGFVIILLWIEE